MESQILLAYEIYTRVRHSKAYSQHFSNGLKIPKS